jgi:hypothetical protein
MHTIFMIHFNLKLSFVLGLCDSMAQQFSSFVSG